MIIGIDLGTTNSLVALWQDGKPRLVPNPLGNYLTPSCVSLDEDGSVLVGEAPANGCRRIRSARPRCSSGTWAATSLSPWAARRSGRRAVFAGAARAEGGCRGGAGAGRHRGRDQRAGLLFRYAAQGHAGRGELAGLKVERLVNEPTAAALPTACTKARMKPSSWSSTWAAAPSMCRCWNCSKA